MRVVGVFLLVYILEGNSQFAGSCNKKTFELGNTYLN